MDPTTPKVAPNTASPQKVPGAATSERNTEVTTLTFTHATLYFVPYTYLVYKQ